MFDCWVIYAQLHWNYCFFSFIFPTIFFVSAGHSKNLMRVSKQSNQNPTITGTPARNTFAQTKAQNNESNKNPFETIRKLSHRHHRTKDHRITYYSCKIICASSLAHLRTGRCLVFVHSFVLFLIVKLFQTKRNIIVGFIRLAWRIQKENKCPIYPKNEKKTHCKIYM